MKENTNGIWLCMNAEDSPGSRLDIKEVCFMCARHKLHTCCRGNVHHSCFYRDSVHIICRDTNDINVLFNNTYLSLIMQFHTEILLTIYWRDDVRYVHKTIDRSGPAARVS